MWFDEDDEFKGHLGVSRSNDMRSCALFLNKTFKVLVEIAVISCISSSILFKLKNKWSLGNTRCELMKMMRSNAIKGPKRLFGLFYWLWNQVRLMVREPPCLFKKAMQRIQHVWVWVRDPWKHMVRHIMSHSCMNI